MTTIPAGSFDMAKWDAKSRAVRTFVQGLALDVATAVILAVSAELHDVQWSRAYWGALGALALKTVVQTVVSYVSRRALPPKPPVPPEGE